LEGPGGKGTGGGGDWVEEGLFKTNAVWRRWWRKEQRVMNTREGNAIVNL
jgi:hypothetical protein